MARIEREDTTSAIHCGGMKCWRVEGWRERAEKAAALGEARSRSLAPLGMTSGGRGRDSLSGALGSAALVGPAQEPPKLGALAPEKPEELPGIEIPGFPSEERLHPPLQIRALPGIQPVALGSRPVVAQPAQH